MLASVLCNCASLYQDPGFPVVVAVGGVDLEHLPKVINRLVFSLLLPQGPLQGSGEGLQQWADKQEPWAQEQGGQCRGPELSGGRTVDSSGGLAARAGCASSK